MEWKKTPALFPDTSLMIRYLLFHCLPKCYLMNFIRTQFEFDDVVQSLCLVGAFKHSTSSMGYYVYHRVSSLRPNQAFSLMLGATPSKSCLGIGSAGSFPT